MARYIIMKMKTVKVSISKPNGKPPSGYKTLWLKTDIIFYEIYDGYKTEEGEEA